MYIKWAKTSWTNSMVYFRNNDKSSMSFAIFPVVVTLCSALVLMMFYDEK